MIIKTKSFPYGVLKILEHTYPQIRTIKQKNVKYKKGKKIIMFIYFIYIYMFVFIDFLP